MTVVCLGGGPSLTAADVNFCRGRKGVRILAINNAIDLAPWADYLYAGDAKWWKWRKGCPEFQGQKYSIDRRVASSYPDVAIFTRTGVTGLETRPWCLRTGRNGGYQAINLAATHLCAKKIVLLGYDMQASPTGEDHWHAPHPDGSHPGYDDCLRRFDTLVAPLAALSIEVVNCSPKTALRAFKCLPLSEVLRP